VTLHAAPAVFATGWGNTGFGVTLLLMPLLYKGFNRLWGPQIAWRAAFFVPAGLQLIAGMLVLVLTDDTPEGRLPMLKRSAKLPAHCTKIACAMAYDTCMCAVELQVASSAKCSCCAV
jgi:nitrate/nitrite transporter NarK